MPQNNNVQYVTTALPRQFFEIMADDHLKPVLDAIGKQQSLPLKTAMPTIRLKVPDKAGNPVPVGFFTASPYMFCFWQLLVSLDRILADELNAYGLIILDEQTKHEKIIENLKVYRYLRLTNLIDRIVDYPVFRTNSQNLMLALPDFTGYIFHRWYCDEHAGKKPQAKIEEWRTEYTLPQTHAGWPDLSMVSDTVGISPEARLKKFLEEGVPLIPKDLAVLQVLMHELVHVPNAGKLNDVAKGAQFISGRRRT